MMGTGPFRRGGLSPLQFLMILQLKKGPRYGYEILKELREHFCDVWEPRTGTIYPALKSLEERGLVKTEVMDAKDFYSLTQRGEALLDRLWKRLEGDLELANKYFEFVNEWLPQSMRQKIVEILRDRTETDAFSPIFVKHIVNGDSDNVVKLEALQSMRKFLEIKLNLVEKMIESVRGSK